MKMPKFIRLAVAAAAACASLAAEADTSAIAYQGVLRDATGGALADVQQTIEFRLYDTATGSDALWGRSIRVNLDTNGLFSVTLEDDNGSALTTATKYSALAEAVLAARDKGLYVGLNVVGSTGEITPRQRLLSVPYATFAHDVNAASGDFAVAGTATLKDLKVEGTAKFAATEFNGKTTFAQPATFSGGITVGGSSSITGNGTIPVGGIIMWSGRTVPDGWALCDGTRGTPNLSGRFVMGGAPQEVGLRGGRESVALETANLPSHRHMYFGDDELAGCAGTSEKDPDSTTIIAQEIKKYDATSRETGNGKKYYTSATGQGRSFSVLPPYYTLAFIMRVK